MSGICFLNGKPGDIAFKEIDGKLKVKVWNSTRIVESVLDITKAYPGCYGKPIGATDSLKDMTSDELIEIIIQKMDDYLPYVQELARRWKTKV